MSHNSFLLIQRCLAALVLILVLYSNQTIKRFTLRWRIVIRVCVALTAVLYQETRIVPGHADNAIRLMQQNVGQHAPVAVHHYYLSICSTK